MTWQEILKENCDGVKSQLLSILDDDTWVSWYLEPDFESAEALQNMSCGELKKWLEWAVGESKLNAYIHESYDDPEYLAEVQKPPLMGEDGKRLLDEDGKVVEGYRRSASMESINHDRAHKEAYPFFKKLLEQME